MQPHPDHTRPRRRAFTRDFDPVLLAALVLMMLGATGCAVLSTTSYKTTDSTTAQGVPYFLPKSVLDIELSVTRSKDAAAACKDEKASCDKAVPDKCSAECKDKSSADCKKCTDTKGADCQDRYDRCQVDATASPDQFKISLSVTPRFVPDPSRLMSLRHKTNELASDEVKIGVDKSGLLQSISATAEDRTPQIIETLGATAINVFKASHGLSDEASHPSVSVLEQILGIHRFSIPMDGLLSGGTVSRQVANSLGKALVEISVSSPSAVLQPAAGSDLKDACGVVVAVAQPYQIKATLLVDSVSKSSVELTANLPDQSPIFEIPVTRVAFSKNVTGLTIANGMLTEESINRGSPVEGFVNVPFHLSEKVVGLPAELVKLKYDGPTQDAALKKQLLDAQIELLKSEAELEKLRNGETDPAK